MIEAAPGLADPRRLRRIQGSVVFCLTAAAWCTASAAVERYRIDPDHTFVHFAVLHTGVSSVRGRVGGAKGTATLDAERQSAEVAVEIDLRTLDTGVKKLDATLSGELFFDVARHRSARFSARAVQFHDGVPTEFEGELTLRGVTRPLRLSAERFVCKEVKILALKRFVCGGDLHATLNRAEFGLDEYLTMISDEVRLSISVEAIREGP
ncbi:MAG TPA: YceI family protein [Burkholderiales bacterium]|jgi:polyisoprenoid-binding protein YceI|nr:YceI family protein [Burkholderiales bacterium]